MSFEKQKMSAAAQAGKSFIKSAELARRLNRARNTIEHWRQRGYGPAYVRVAQAILYDEAVVEAWIAENTHESTAEYVTHQTAPALQQRGA